MEQINIFDLLKQQDSKQHTMSVAREPEGQKATDKRVVEKKKAEIPKEVIDIYNKLLTAQNPQAFFGTLKTIAGDVSNNVFYRIRRYRTKEYVVVGSMLQSCSWLDEGILIRAIYSKDMEMTNFLLLLAGNVYTIPAFFKIKRETFYESQHYYERIEVKEVIVKPPKKVEKIIDDDSCTILVGDAKEQIEKFYAYDKDAIYELNNQNFPLIYCLMAPQAILLKKAEFAFMKNTRWIHEQSSIEMFNRLTQPGKNPDEIFKCSRFLYKLLKNTPQLTEWDRFRKMEKKKICNQSDLRAIYESGFTDRQMSLVYEILGKVHEQRQVLTLGKLERYLERVDLYEAIGRDEALILLRDYLQMCQCLKVKPNLNGDSLKREHDVTARLVRMKSDEIMHEKMKPACERLQRYNYEEGDFLIRGVQNYDDLGNEGNQQRNCVKGYARAIAAGKALIFFMRRKDAPNKSLVTVELAPDHKSIRQKFLACNQPIRDAAMSEFLDNWLKHVSLIDNEKKAA